MKRMLVLTVYLVALTLTPGFAGEALTMIDGKPEAPAFELVDLDGVSHRLSDFRGQPLIINFWATWCPPCREELPAMNRAWDKLRGQGVQMLAVNVGEDVDTIFTFTGDYPIDFTVLLDESGEIISRWPVKGLPTTFIVDPEGRLVYRAIGGRQWDDDALLDVVRALRQAASAMPDRNGSQN